LLKAKPPKKKTNRVTTIEILVKSAELSSKSNIEKMTKSGLIVPARIDVAESKTFISGQPKSSHVFIDEIKACAEKLKNTTQALYDKAQTLTANESDKDIAQKIVAIEGYLELVGGGKRDLNKARKAVAQELNVYAGIGE
jgi:hypothetical protein